MFKFICSKKHRYRYEAANLKSGMQKTIFQRDIFRMQSDKTPIGLHGEGGKSNLSDRGP